jgi:hypothetical protein
MAVTTATTVSAGPIARTPAWWTTKPTLLEIKADPTAAAAICQPIIRGTTSGPTRSEVRTVSIGSSGPTPAPSRANPATAGVVVAYDQRTAPPATAVRRSPPPPRPAAGGTHRRRLTSGRR